MLPRRSLFRSLAVVLLLLPPIAAQAVTRVVPTQEPTIQRGIWASASGDTVLVLPGTYVENILIDRALVLRSAGGPAVTVIDGGDPANPDSASTVTMRAGEITGFDIRNGAGTHGAFDEWHGGGILAIAPGTVRGNWIHDNVIVGYRGVGGGIYVETESPFSVRENLIYRNRVEAEYFGYAGGVAAFGSETLVEGNLISSNHVEHGNAAGAYGWGAFQHNVIACNTVVTGPFAAASGLYTSGSVVEGNTIIFNWGIDDPPALRILASDCSPGPPCPVQVFGNIVAYNTGIGVECQLEHGQGTIDFACNDFYSNAEPFSGQCGSVVGQNGNIVADPQFGRGSCPSHAGDWCLGESSPLLPENSPPGCGLIGALGECPLIGIGDAPPPGQLRSEPAVPNPFAERTTIPFSVTRAGPVEIAIVDVLGRQVRTLHQGTTAAGHHTVAWDGRTDAGTRAVSGAYIAIIRSGADQVTRPLLLLR